MLSFLHICVIIYFAIYISFFILQKCCHNPPNPLIYEETVPCEVNSELNEEDNLNPKEKNIKTNSSQHEWELETKSENFVIFPKGRKNFEISFRDSNNSDTKENSFQYETTTNKILLSGELFYFKEVLVDSNGIKNSLRNKNDTKAFFGISDTKDYNDNCYNDFIINIPDDKKKLSSSNSTGRVFEISYSKITNDYSISVIHKQMTLYYQIESLFFFNDNKEYLFRIGKIFVLFYQKEVKKEKYIEIDIQYQHKQFESFVFGETSVPISIGRINCLLNINHSSISKTHAVIDFSNDSKKFYFKDLKSTNGTTLIMKEDDSLKIKGEMKFKLDNIPFKLWEMP